MKYGWGNCQHCGWDVGATKNGKAVRHGYIRIRKARRKILPDIPVGTDYGPCQGSGKPLRDFYDLSVERKK